MGWREIAKNMRGSVGRLLGVQVTYTRGAQSITIRATKARTDIEVQNNQFLIESQIVDWLIEASEIYATFGDPQRGDKITHTTGDGADEFTYEAMPIGSEKEWRWHDPEHTTYRIHTKHTELVIT